MNTDTGQIYRGMMEIEAARQRGEPIVEVSEHVANTMETARHLLGDIPARQGLTAGQLRKRMRDAGIGRK